LTRIREATPPDAIVTTWWDYGHWAKYVTERRVTADGASLLTHIPYWIGRALLAPTEREAVGLLRMLSCGSDATPEPEGSRGAYGKLLARGIDPIVAQSVVVTLASLDRAAARAELVAGGLSGPAAADVLASTHCSPAPTYLVLNDNLIFVDGWRSLGSWDFPRAYVAHAARDRPEAEAVADLVARFEVSEPEARAAYRQARALRSNDEVLAFVAPHPNYFARDWFSCRVTDAGDAWICPIGLGVGESGPVLEAFEYVPEAPARSRLHFRERDDRAAGSRRFTGAPATIVRAGPAAMDETSLPRPTTPDLGVLVDTVERRILVGPPYLLRSTFTHLVFLDGRYARRFEKFDERAAPGGERVVTWHIRTEPHPSGDGGG
jgi:hypothetical protein